jgi:hypothetical protein
MTVTAKESVAAEGSGQRAAGRPANQPRSGGPADTRPARVGARQARDLQDRQWPDTVANPRRIRVR